MSRFLFFALTYALLAATLVILVGRFLVVPAYKRHRVNKERTTCPPFLLPPLPETLNHSVTAPSRRYLQRQYRVNLQRMTCSCGRFHAYHRYYEVPDIRRICRHQLRVLRENPVWEELDELTRCILNFRSPDRCYRRLPLQGGDTAFGFHPRSRYVRVYTRRRHPDDPEGGPFTGHYAKYVYNTRQEVWIYGEAPPLDPTLLAAAIKELFPNSEQR